MRRGGSFRFLVIEADQRSDTKAAAVVDVAVVAVVDVAVVVVDVVDVAVVAVVAVAVAVVAVAVVVVVAVSDVEESEAVGKNFFAVVVLRLKDQKQRLNQSA